MAKKKLRRPPRTILWTVYLLRCADGSLYCGVTIDLKRRILEHNSGKGAKYTSSRTPCSLAASRGNLSKKEAYMLEYKIKQLPRLNKIPFVESL